MDTNWLSELVPVDGSHAQVHQSCRHMVAKPPTPEQREVGLSRCQQLRQMIQQHKDNAKPKRQPIDVSAYLAKFA